MNIYVTNLHDAIGDKELAALFEPYGTVVSSEVMMDVFANVSRGFGYVEMEDEAARKAIEALDQTLVQDLKITVQEAEPKKEMKGSYKVGNPGVNAYRFRKN